MNVLLLRAGMPSRVGAWRQPWARARSQRFPPTHRGRFASARDARPGRRPAT